MKTRGIARNPMAAAAICCLLLSAGCSGAGNLGNSDVTGTPVAALKPEGDWAATMLAGGRVGIGMFPAKFTFDITAAPDCTNDFVAMNTSLTGVPWNPNVSRNRFSRYVLRT